MIQIRSIVWQRLPLICGRQTTLHQRAISALYITGDKAKENYVTLQPYMDFEGTLAKREQLELSIAQRKMQINYEDILKKFSKYKDCRGKIKQVEQEREAIAKKLKTLSKTTTSPAAELNSLKEQGKTLRSNLKSLKEHFYPIEDDFVHAFLNLPNELHTHCPHREQEKLIYRSTATPTTTKNSSHISHLERTDLIHFVDKNRYYMMGAAAEFDVNCTQALAHYFVQTAGFTQTANPDFVRCVLLEAAATPLTQYHKVREEQLQNKLNAAYLTGGAAFESFLGAVTKLCVYPTVVPLRFVSCGRNFQQHANRGATEHNANLFTATQTNAVQTFVAASSANEADQHFEEILDLAINFYKALAPSIHFRIIYADASILTPSECLRAVIEMYSPVEQRYVSVGYVSNYLDFISRRLLFSMRRQQDYHFLHLVGGPVMFTTQLIATLIENGIPLAECQCLGTEATKAEEVTTSAKSGVQEFKTIFH